ncbi:32762_t:CDS:1, partial [Gigaspora margarita]
MLISDSLSELNNNSTHLSVSTPNSSPSNRCRGNYVKAACEPCKKAKVKCTGDMPCDRCSSSKQEDKCEYKPQKKRGPRSKSCDSRQDNSQSSLRRSRSCGNRRRSNCHSATIRTEDNNNALGISLQPPNNNLPTSGLNYSNPVFLFITPPQPEILQNNYQLDLNNRISHSPQSPVSVDEYYDYYLSGCSTPVSIDNDYYDNCQFNLENNISHSSQNDTPVSFDDFDLENNISHSSTPGS